MQKYSPNSAAMSGSEQNSGEYSMRPERLEVISKPPLEAV